MSKAVSLNEHLRTVGNVTDDLRHVILTIGLAAKDVHHAIRTTDTGLAGSKNHYGEEQVKLDVLSDELIIGYLRASKQVASFASEEHDDIIEHDRSLPFSVVFDPLDGSSLIDADFAVGSIFGIYPGPDIIGRKPSEQVAALYTLYGPRTVLVYCAGNGVHEFVLNEVGEFTLVREFLGIADEAKHYSPGNLRAITDNAGYRNTMMRWLEEEKTLRYSGCMVADVHHIFAKGQGIFANVGGKKYPEGKLRLAFECGPFAYLAHQAGGSASDGSQSILEQTIMRLDQRSPIVIGSSKEVEKVCRELKA